MLSCMEISMKKSIVSNHLDLSMLAFLHMSVVFKSLSMVSNRLPAHGSNALPPMLIPLDLLNLSPMHLFLSYIMARPLPIFSFM